jgi:hypothetical protein
LAAAGSRCRPAAWCRKSPAPPTEIGCQLAISFHATTDEVRDVLVPINKRWNIATLLDGAARLSERLSNSERITFEYVMLDGVNDSKEDDAPAGQADRGHPGQDQPDPVQRMARRALQAVVREPDRGLCRHHLQGRLRQPDPHPARRGHHGRLRAVEIGHRTGAEIRARDRRRGRAVHARSAAARAPCGAAALRPSPAPLLTSAGSRKRAIGLAGTARLCKAELGSRLRGSTVSSATAMGLHQAEQQRVRQDRHHRPGHHQIARLGRHDAA